MRHKLIAAALSVVAVVPFVLQDPKPLVERVAALEKRVDALERAQPAPPAPAGTWNQERIRWLFYACTDLRRIKAKELLAQGEKVEEMGNAIARAGSLAYEAEMEWVKQRPARASRMSDEALALYNLVARFVGMPERTDESPKPESPPEPPRKGR
ncbi:MAG: hypothetical protein WAT39_19510 [Planctomycetota bacterium]